MKNFKKILSVILENKNNSILFLLSIILFSSILETLTIGMVIPLISELTNSSSSNFVVNFFEHIILNLKNFGLFSNDKNILIIIILSLFSIVILIKTFVLIFYIYYLGKFKYNLIINLTNKIFSNYLKKSYNFFLKENSSILIRNCTAEIEIFMRCAESLSKVFNEIILFFFILIFLFIFNFKVTVFSLIFFSIFGYLYLRFTKNKVYQLGIDAQFLRGRNFQYARETFGAIKEIIIYDKFSYFKNQYSNAYKKISLINWFTSILETLPRHLLELLMFIGVFILIFFNATLFNNSENILIILAVYAAAAYKLLPGINQIVVNLQQIKLYEPAIKIIYEHSKLKNFTKINLEESKLIPFKEEIEIKDLTFAYNKNSNILEKANFKISKGKFIGIFGDSGAGKSTLMDLICGVQKNYSGTIAVDKKPINFEINRRLNIGYVPQNTYLFDGTFEKNIAFGVPSDEISIEKLDNAINNAGLSELINSFEEKEKKLIGEKGLSLSGGQRQRIGIARALYSDPEIIVLDESLNALDLDTELKIIQSMKKMIKKTVIIISHRMSTLDQCDEIYKVKNKNIHLFKKF